MKSNDPHFTVRYEEPLRTHMAHEASGQTVTTDAPVDNQGKGQAFSPTDLVCAATASCVMTIMGIKAHDMGYTDIEMNAQVWKTMASNPRRIALIEIELQIEIPGVTEKSREILERTTRGCPVARSLHPDLVKEVRFVWNYSQTSTSA